MSTTGLRAIIRETCDAVPGTAIAAAGTSLAIFTFESNRMASFQSVPAASAINSASMLSAVVFLALLAFWYWRRPALRIHRHPLAGFLVAGLLSASLLSMSSAAGSAPSQLLAIASVAGGVLKPLLILCWVEVLCGFSGRHCAVIVALAFGVTGVLNCCSAFIKQEAVLLLVAMLPLLSVACLYWLKDKQDSFDTPRPLTRGRGAEKTFVLRATGPFTRGLVLVYLAPLPFLTFAFGFIHYTWVPFQDGGGNSLAIQMAAALGTVLAALLLLLLIAYFWGPKKIELYSLIILFFLGISLCVSTMFSGMLPGLYVVPLNIAQKMTLFLVLISPFLMPARRSSMAMAAMAAMLYNVGRACTNLAASLLQPPTYSLVVLAAMTVAALLIIAGIVMNGNTDRRRSDGLAKGADGNADGDAQAAARAVKLRKSAIVPSAELLQSGAGLKEARGGDGASSSMAARREGASAQAAASTETATPSQPTMEAACRSEAPSAATAPFAPEANERERTLDACDRLARSHGLTNREREILYLLAQGLNAGAIAEELTVSTSTVKTHMRNVYAKLEVHTQNELLLMVHRG